MFRVTLRNLLARKLRLLMSAFAIVLGVAFVGGSLIFTDAMGGAFDDIIEGTVADVEVAYPGATDATAFDDNRTLPASLAEDLAALPDVAEVHPVIQSAAVFVVGENGKVVGGNGPPGIAVNRTDARALTGKPMLTLESGQWPTGLGEVALDVDTAQRAGYRVGDDVRLVTPVDPPTLEARLTGTVEFGSGALVGATIAVFDTGYLQDLLQGGRDVYSFFNLEAAEGVSQQELVQAVQPLLPDGVRARTGDSVAQANKEELDNAFLRYIRIFMLVFAGIALVVGAFLIVNTFSILVAQRSRELALLRALGASRRQVVGSVLLEAAAVGLIGSTLGLLFGIVVAQGIRGLLGAFGLDLGGTDFPVRPTTVLWCYLLGVLVTVVAALLPALRASRVPPMAALRDDVALPETTLRRRVAAGAGLVLFGIVSVVVGFATSGGTGLSMVGLGLFLILIGVALASPFLARPMIQLFGSAYRRLFGSVGQLATGNSLRNPRRLAATSSALMIGVALVSMVSIVGASVNASTEVTANEALKADLVISNIVGQPFSTAIAEEARRVDGVRAVAQVQQVFPATVDGDATALAGVDPTDLVQALDLRMVEGSLADLGPETIATSDDTARSHGWELGDPIQVTLQAGLQTLTLAAVYESNPAVPGGYLVTRETLAKGGLAPRDSMVFVVNEPGSDPGDVKSAIDAATRDQPTVTVKDPQGFADELKEQTNQFLFLIYALLGLSIVIAFLGVINTLGLSVIERTREVGLLRAVGLSRRQLRTMIRLESVVIGVFGAFLGVVVGTAFGVSLVRALQDQGLSELSVPYGALAALVVAAGVAGVLAAVWPGRRAARLDVLRAIATE